MPVVVAVPVFYLFVSGSSRDVLIGLLAVSAHGYVLAYVLLCVATPAFLRRIGELTRLPVIVGVLTATAMVALVGWAAFSRTYVAGAATAVYLLLMLVGAAVFAIRARRSPGIEESVIPRWEPRALTARTIVARSKLLANLDLIRSQGFATQLAELRDASACIAVPIRSDTGALIASIALSGHVDHHHLMLRHVPSLQEQAGRLGRFIA